MGANSRFGEKDMSTWMVIVGIWAMFAVCVVLFIRGATSRVAHAGEKANEIPEAPHPTGDKATPGGV
jgi:hypothetical protein